MVGLNWQDGLDIDPVIRGELLALETAVLAKTPKSIAEILQTKPLPIEAQDALSKLPELDFTNAFARAIRSTTRKPTFDFLREVHMKAIAQSVMVAHESAIARAKMFEYLTPGVRVTTFFGGDHTFRKGGDLNDEQCFPRPANIDVPDVQTLCNFFRETYQKEYPNWLRILQGAIPKDLTNPEVDFATIRIDEKLVAIAKSYPLALRDGPQVPHYFGTHYVDPAYQRGFGLGNLVQATAMHRVKASDPVYGYVAPSNQALFRHFHANGILGFGLGRDQDSQGESEELLQVVIAPLCGFDTVHHSRYPDERIIHWASGEVLPEDLKERVRVHSFKDPSREGLIACMRAHFEERRVMTRGVANDGDKTMVFEHRFHPKKGWLEWDKRQAQQRARAGFSVLDPRY